MPGMRLAAALMTLAVGLVGVGCGGEAGEETTVPAMTAPATPTTTVAASTTTAAAPKVEVVEDLVYHSASASLREALLDVYALPGTTGGPVVVIFHGGGVARYMSPYPALASALAEQGAVVFVPDWDKGQPVTDTTREDLLAWADGGACAVSYALAHAAEYGADPERLVLFGHSGGANVASLVGLREAVPLPECAVEMTPFAVDGMVLWEGDWLASDTVWDRYGEGLPLVMEGITPWVWLAAGPRMPVELVTTPVGRNEQRRCDVAEADTPYWERDPDGWFRERLEASGALADGCIDVGEPTEILADVMREQRFEVVELLTEEATHATLHPEGRALLVAEILTIADR